MGDKLVIVESPAKAKTIQKYLGRGYRVTSSMGHVRDLPKRDLAIDVEHDFQPVYEITKQKVVSELDLTAEALQANQDLETIAPYVPDSGEGRWTVIDSVDQGVATPVLTSALQMRFASRNEMGYGFRLLSLMRNAFGGHAVKQTE